jgi:hypothetical protein
MSRTMCISMVWCVAACSGERDFLVPSEEPLAEESPGSPCGVDRDYEDDGTFDSVSRYFDEDGGRTWRVEERDADGALLHDEVWRYDAAGRVLELTWRVDGQRTQHRVWVYDAFGRGLRWERDDDGDGIYEEIETATGWNAQGGVTTTSIARPGAEPLSSESDYDELGRLTLRVYRAGGDEVRRTEVIYDDVARTRTTRLTTPSNRFELVREFSPGGRLLRMHIRPLIMPSSQPEILEEFRYDGDRLVESVSTYEHGTSRSRYRYCD